MKPEHRYSRAKPEGKTYRYDPNSRTQPPQETVYKITPNDWKFYRTVTTVELDLNRFPSMGELATIMKKGKSSVATGLQRLAVRGLIERKIEGPPKRPRITYRVPRVDK